MTTEGTDLETPLPSPLLGGGTRVAPPPPTCWDDRLSACQGCALQTGLNDRPQGSRCYVPALSAATPLTLPPRPDTARCTSAEGTVRPRRQAPSRCWPLPVRETGPRCCYTMAIFEHLVVPRCHVCSDPRHGGLLKTRPLSWSCGPQLVPSIQVSWPAPVCARVPACRLN